MLMKRQLRYDGSSAYEEDDRIPSGFKLQSRSTLLKELECRAAAERERRELVVYYYRIGYTFAFPLPLCEMPENLPQNIPGIAYYPWSVWLLWELRERWHTFYHAWRKLGDSEAGRLLQLETACLLEWDTYFDGPEGAGLCTGHLASCLAEFLSDSEGWDAELYTKALKAGHRLIEKNVAPWFEQKWKDRKELGEESLANIPCIVLMSSANLARTIGNSHLDELDEKSLAVFKTWCKCRTQALPYTEGTAYDAYFLDSAVEWVQNRPDRDRLLEMGAKPFETALESWLHLALPGRADIHAPIGDVEPEMPFWMNTMARIAFWYGRKDGLGFLSRVPAVRLTSRALCCLLENTGESLAGTEMPQPAPVELVSALCLRTGWDMEDCLVAAAYGRTKTGHLHFDGGSVVIGRQGCFWITDPGYQQYRKGEERDFSLGMAAHNAPVVCGKAQSARKAGCTSIGYTEEGYRKMDIDLTGCYEGLDGVERICRKVRLIHGDNVCAAVYDGFDISCGEIDVGYSWQGGTHLAWSFKDGWARLSDGKQALWIGCSQGGICPGGLVRHTGSRGPLTLTQTVKVTRGSRGVWWLFCFDDTAGWQPPAVEYFQRKLTLKPCGGRDIVIDMGESC